MSSKITFDVNKVVYAQYFNELNMKQVEREKELNMLREPVFKLLTSKEMVPETVVMMRNNGVNIHIAQKVSIDQDPLEPHILISVKYRNYYPNSLTVMDGCNTELYGRMAAIDLIFKEFCDELKKDYRLNVKLNSELQTMTIFYPDTAISDNSPYQMRVVDTFTVSSKYDGPGDY